MNKCQRTTRSGGTKFPRNMCAGVSADEKEEAVGTWLLYDVVGHVPAPCDEGVISRPACARGLKIGVTDRG